VASIAVTQSPVLGREPRGRPLPNKLAAKGEIDLPASDPSVRLHPALSAALAALALAATGCATTQSTAREYARSPCAAEPRYACPDAKDCPADARTFLGEASEFKSQRSFFLD
jgi:hypothetical protein